MSEGQDGSGIDVLNQILTALASVAEDERQRVIKAVNSYFGISVDPQRRVRPLTGGSDSPGTSTRVDFSDDLAISPKDFILEKQPHTDVERIACLAFYLTHYRNTPFFKTIDLSNLNTEAAQPKFSNATVASNNAQLTGYLVPAGKGTRQLSAAGEQYVRALPDREAARKVMDALHRRKRSRKSAAKTENETRP